jgi:hypothetical protein
MSLGQMVIAFRTSLTNLVASNILTFFNIYIPSMIDQITSFNFRRRLFFLTALCWIYILYFLILLLRRDTFLLLVELRYNCLRM